ncbi:MAG: hypothetical protein U9P10_01595 [Thermodesulfobacteriota bacterium]|nr:hypothetical protein [Thermodesulfobacteriota bacterium]
MQLFYDHSDYIDYCIETAADILSKFSDITDLSNHLDQINAHEHLNELENPRHVFQLDKNELTTGDYIKTWKCIAEGRLFMEHTLAGEATRLKLGTKYLIKINIAEDLSLSEITHRINRENSAAVSEDFIRMQLCCDPSELLPLSLGIRHMLQYAYDIYTLSKLLGYDPEEVLSKQKMLIVLNEATADIIIDEFIKHRFYGFSRENVYFMVQRSYHGINLKGKKVFYDNSAPRRLHNHGHIAIQQTMTHEIFRINGKKWRSYISHHRFGRILDKMEVKVTYNIEDLDYLNRSLDYETIALAIKKGREGYHMVMEVLPNNPDNPQKGGMAAYDPVLERDVIIESFQLNGINPHEIQFINKNINYYPNPYTAWETVKNQGIHLPLAVKNGFVYFQPVIGDINFLVKTAILTRSQALPIKAWKSIVHTPLAVNCMYVQDAQKGFSEFANRFVNLS